MPIPHSEFVRCAAFVFAFASSDVALHALPAPGDVFREYTWSNQGKWQRITAPDATHKEAKPFLPNPR
jgi:hypothetical protein